MKSSDKEKKKPTQRVGHRAGEVLAEYNDLDTAAGPMNQYIYAGNKRIAMYDETGKLYFYLSDHLGSASVLIDSLGTVRDKYRYRPFGNAESGQSINVGQAYRYTGKPLDEELSMNWYYYGARYYAPAEGRFLSVDPLAGKYPGWGPYVYTLDNPLRFVDPQGMASQEQQPAPAYEDEKPENTHPVTAEDGGVKLNAQVDRAKAQAKDVAQKAANNLQQVGTELASNIHQATEKAATPLGLASLTSYGLAAAAASNPATAALTPVLVDAGNAFATAALVNEGAGALASGDNQELLQFGMDIGMSVLSSQALTGLTPQREAAANMMLSIPPPNLGSTQSHTPNQGGGYHMYNQP